MDAPDVVNTGRARHEEVRRGAHRPPGRWPPRPAPRASPARPRWCGSPTSSLPPPPPSAASTRCRCSACCWCARTDGTAAGPPGTAGWPPPPGVFFAVDLVLWHHAIAAVGAGIATVLGNLQVVVVGFLAWWLLGERPSAPAGRGGAGGPGRGRAHLRRRRCRRLRRRPGARRRLRARHLARLRRRSCCCSGRAPATCAARPARCSTRPRWRRWSASRSAPVSGGIDLVPCWPAHGWLVILALTSQVVGWLLIAVSLPRVPAALTSVILLLQPVASVGLSAAVLDRAAVAGPAARVRRSSWPASSPPPPAAAHDGRPPRQAPRRGAAVPPLDLTVRRASAGC